MELQMSSITVFFRKLTEMMPMKVAGISLDTKKYYLLLYFLPEVRSHFLLAFVLSQPKVTFQTHV